MSYISACKPYGSNDVIIWERTSQGREVFQVPAPYYFYAADKNGKHTTIYGDKCSKLTFNSNSQLKQAKEALVSDGVEVYESDIPPELRVLSEKYYNTNPPPLHYTLLDIEVDYSPDIGFADTNNPYAPINAVALYHEWSKKAVCIAVPPDDSWTHERAVQEIGSIVAIPSDLDFELVLVKNERELLLMMLEEIEDSDILSAWNGSMFDMPYIAARLEKMGKKYTKRLCFPEAEDIKWGEVEVYGKINKLVELSGRSHVDYMDLFKKYSVVERQSYKLEVVAEEILPHLPKLDYEGSLANLYKNDFAYFLRYNVRDTEILAGFEAKLGYLDVANKMVHISTGLFKHVLGTLKLAELATVNFCHYTLNQIVPDIKHMDDGGIQGAYVLYPQVGEAKLMANIDITSLYPTAIRSINMSPETLVGQFIEEIAACEEIYKRSDKMLTLVMEHTDEQVTMTAKDFREYLSDRKWSISGFGTVFDQTKQGAVPALLTEWFKTRKDYQKKQKDALKAAEAILNKYKQ